MSSHKTNVEKPELFIFMFLLFFLSVGLIVYGIVKNRNQSSFKDLGSYSDTTSGDEDNDNSLSKYFEKNQDTGSGSGKDDYYLQTDPFRETCKPGSGKTPYVISGTVCYR